MTRLDAAARFKFAMELAHTTDKQVANREQATTAFTTEIVVSTVMNRDAAVVRARSEFSIVAAKPVVSVSCFVSMDRFPAASFRWVNWLLSRNFCRNRTFCCSNDTDSARFWPANCLRLLPRKQAIPISMCRIRENEPSTPSDFEAG